MAKGISIKFKSYNLTIPKILDLIKLDSELKKHDNIVLKPFLRNSESNNSSKEFVEAILRYVLSNKKPDAQVYLAEGSDGEDTLDVFEKFGFGELSEKYSVSLIDLNNAEVESVSSNDFLKNESIQYPKLLLNSFLISVPKLSEDAELEMVGSLSNMIGAYPAKYYKGFFSSRKNKLNRWPMKYNISDIVKCKMPQLAIIDASEQGSIVCGVPLEMDKISAKLLGKEWKSISHLKLVDERLVSSSESDEEKMSEVMS